MEPINIERQESIAGQKYGRSELVSFCVDNWQFLTGAVIALATITATVSQMCYWTFFDINPLKHLPIVDLVKGAVSPAVALSLVLGVVVALDEKVRRTRILGNVLIAFVLCIYFLNLHGYTIFKNIALIASVVLSVAMAKGINGAMIAVFQPTPRRSFLKESFIIAMFIIGLMFASLQRGFDAYFLTHYDTVTELHLQGDTAMISKLQFLGELGEGVWFRDTSTGDSQVINKGNVVRMSLASVTSRSRDTGTRRNFLTR